MGHQVGPKMLYDTDVKALIGGVATNKRPSTDLLSCCPSDVGHNCDGIKTEKKAIVVGQKFKAVGARCKERKEHD